MKRTCQAWLLVLVLICSLLSTGTVLAEDEFTVDSVPSESESAITVTESAESESVADILIEESIESEEADFQEEQMKLDFAGGEIAKIGSVSYESLEEAIAAAHSGDVVTLLQDVTVVAMITIDKGITLDLGGRTVTAGSGVSGQLFHVSTTESTTIRNGTLDGQEVTSARAVYVSGNNADRIFTMEEVTVRNFTSGSHGGGVSVLYGQAVVSDCVFTGNSVEVNGGRGGGFYANNIKSVRIENSTFSDNKAVYIGGAICISNVEDTCKISGNTITDNAVIRESGRSVGGGIGITNPQNADIDLENNTISGNAVTNTGGQAIGGGVGLINTAGGDRATITFTGNEITYNIASGASSQGGGIGNYLGNSGMDSLSDVIIRSGTIAYNEASWGGGIANIVKRTGDTYFYNALVTENTAIRGGGIWACPTAETAIYTTKGCAVYNNTAIGGPLSNGALSSGDDIRYEADDSDILPIINGTSSTSYLTVSPRALGGGMVDWYADNPEARFQEGDLPVDVEIEYTHRQTSGGLHGTLDAEAIAAAKQTATLFIYGNTAGLYGGGVATNSPATFGEFSESSVTVNKIWLDKEGQVIEDTTEFPESVEVTLIRITAAGEEVELETVILNAENDWTHTFTMLPADDAYRVRETVPDGYRAVYEEDAPSENESGGTDYYLTIKNSPSETPPAPEEPENPNESEEPEKSESSKTTSKVSTGDSANGIIWAWFIIFGAVAMIAIYHYKRKREHFL